MTAAAKREVGPLCADVAIAPTARRMRRGSPPPSPAKSRDWHDYATPEERLDLEGLEKNAQLLDERRQSISLQLHLIRNRCLARRLRDMKREKARRA